MAKQDWETSIGMEAASASVTGSPFSTWAGPVQMALSGEMRRTSIEDISNFQPTDAVNCTGLRFNGCQPGGTPRARWAFAGNPRALQPPH